MKLDKRYLVIASILFILTFIISYIYYPDWQGKWWSLIISAISGIISRFSDFRQAFEKKQEDNCSIKKSFNRKKTIQNHTEITNRESLEINVFDRSRVIIANLDNNENGDYGKTNVELCQKPLNCIGIAPPRPTLMIGRDVDIDKIKRKLNINRDISSYQNNIFVVGIPGVGKTTVASALVYDQDIDSMFPDGVMWTSLGLNPNILSELSFWGNVLGLDKVSKSSSIREIQTLLTRFLCEKSMLFIIDDVWKVDHVLPFIMGGKKCASIITTRELKIANKISPVEDCIYPLKVLSEEKAIEVLDKLAHKVVIQYPEECKELVRAVECLPLALQVAGRLLHSEVAYGFSVKQLLDELQKTARLLEEPVLSDRIDIVKESSPTVASLLFKSVQMLDKRTIELFGYLGYFAPKPATFDMEIMSKIWGIDDPKSVITELIDHGLLEFIPESGLYQMHALLVMLAKTINNKHFIFEKA